MGANRCGLIAFAPLCAAVVLFLACAGGSNGAVLSPGDIYVAPVAGGASRALTPGSYPAVSPDGLLIAYVRAGRIWLMRPDGSEQRQLTTRGGGRPFWSPDGRRLVFTVWNTDPCNPPPKTKCAVTDIWTVNADGRGERLLFARALQPAWSPGGRRLVFRAFLGPAEADMGVGALKVAAADGSHVRTLFPGPTFDATRSQPAWSPDGKWIVFERKSYSDPTYRLYLIRADGSQLHRLTSGTYPAWSPNGKLIAFERDELVGDSWKTAVWVIPPSGKQARRISAYAERGRCPTWSPDGTRLALVTTVYRGQAEPLPPQVSSALSIVRPDGTGRKTLPGPSPCIVESSFPSPPSWSRDGRDVYYAG